MYYPYNPPTNTNSVTTAYIHTPQVCPTCGKCPTCGGYQHYPKFYYTTSQPYVTTSGISVNNTGIDWGTNCTTHTAPIKTGFAKCYNERSEDDGA